MPKLFVCKLKNFGEFLFQMVICVTKMSNCNFDGLNQSLMDQESRIIFLLFSVITLEF